MSHVAGMTAPGGGLAIASLIKLKKLGKITTEQFLELVDGVDGFTADSPVELPGDAPARPVQRARERHQAGC